MLLTCGIYVTRIYVGILAEVFIYGTIGVIIGNIIFFSLLSSGYILSYDVRIMDIVFTYSVCLALICITTITVMSRIVPKLKKETVLHNE